MLDSVIADHLDRAEACWVTALTRVDAADLDAQSGCEEWTNRELISHLIGGGLRYGMLLRQDRPAKVEATREVDHLGEDPLETFWRYERTFRRLADIVDLRRPVRHRIGRIPAAQLVKMRILELALHAADLSVGTGDEWPVDDELAEFMAEDLGDLIVSLRGDGRYEAPRDDHADLTSAAEEVLWLAGR